MGTATEGPDESRLPSIVASEDTKRHVLFTAANTVQSAGSSETALPHLREKGRDVIDQAIHCLAPGDLTHPVIPSTEGHSPSTTCCSMDTRPRTRAEALDELSHLNRVLSLI